MTEPMEIMHQILRDKKLLIKKWIEMDNSETKKLQCPAALRENVT